MQSTLRVALLRAMPAVIVLLLLGLAQVRAEEAVIVILNPQAEEIIHDNTGAVAVSVGLGKGVGLTNGRRLRVLLDGLPSGPDGVGGSLNVVLRDVARGEHSLQAMLVDRAGNPLAASEPVRFYMWRASRLFPSRKK